MNCGMEVGISNKEDNKWFVMECHFSLNSELESGSGLDPEVKSIEYTVKHEAISAERDLMGEKGDQGLQLSEVSHLIDNKEWFLKSESLEKMKTEIDKCLKETEIITPDRYIEETEEETTDNLEALIKKTDFFSCQYCSFLSSDQNFLEMHTQVAHKKTFPCGHCGYRAARKLTLKNHIESVHLGERSYQCSFCSYRASYSSNLKNHIDSVHNRLKKFQCFHCDYRANRKSHMKNHIDSIHVGNRPYMCDLCDYKANRLTHLRCHIDSIHKKEKPFTCPHCEYRAAQRGSLKLHIDSIHIGKKAFHCPHCVYRANQRGHLRRHLITKHNVKIV